MNLRLNEILLGDARQTLNQLPEGSVDCVITSPPYYQLRDYGVPGQLGLEPSVSAWVDELRLVFSGLARVLKPSGSLWLNLGDSYSRQRRFGAPPKGMLLAPERLLLALAEDGWIVRNKLIWAKTNPMPESVGDRLSSTYDVVYFLVRSPRYFFDLDAIRLPHRSQPGGRRSRPWPPAGAGAPSWGKKEPGNRGLTGQRARGEVGHRLGKNPGDVWQLASASYRGGHFATFPPQLVERPLLATCPERICQACHAPYRRTSDARRQQLNPGRPGRSDRLVRRYQRRYTVIRQRGPLLPGCSCQAPVRPGVVLDPFFGAGTVGLVAEQHGRGWLGIELSPDYARLADQRIAEARAKRAGQDSTRVRGGTAA